MSYVNTTGGGEGADRHLLHSSNAVEVVASIPSDREVLFCPDQFLGAHVRRMTGRENLHVWAGECHVHAGINGDELDRPGAHPPGRRAVRPPRMRLRHFGALYLAGEGAFPAGPGQDPVHRGMLDAAKAAHAKQVLVATEVGMLHQLRRAAPVSTSRRSTTGRLAYMKMITRRRPLRCLVEGADEVDVDQETADKGAGERAADDRDRPTRRWGMSRETNPGLGGGGATGSSAPTSSSSAPASPGLVAALAGIERAVAQSF